MKDQFKIYIDRLQNGQEEMFQGDFSPEFLSVEEKELQLHDPVNIDGLAYIANDQLIINVSVKIRVKIPCIICNKMSDLNISIPSIYLSEELKNIKNRVFDFSEVLRGSILLEIPHFTECNLKNCPERANMNLYLKKESKDHHFPFQGLQT